MKNSQPTKRDAQYCPSCGQKNGCAIEALTPADREVLDSNKAKAISCWCMEQPFSGVSSDEASPELSCYCPACLSKHKGQ